MKRDNSGYKPMSWKDIEESPIYAYKSWQKDESNREDVLQEFIDFLARDVICEDEKEEKKVKAALKIIQEAMPLFLNQDLKTIKQGEQELLAHWTQSVKGA